MHDKNEDIHLFIIDEDRKKDMRARGEEDVLREWLQKPAEQQVTPPQNSFAIQEELSKETISASESNQLASEKQEYGLRGTELEFSKAGIFGFERALYWKALRVMEKIEVDHLTVRNDEWSKADLSAIARCFCVNSLMATLTAELSLKSQQVGGFRQCLPFRL